MKRSLPVVIAIVVYFVAVLLWVGTDRRIAKHAFDDYSIANTSDEGLSLASAYLRRTGHDVHALNDAITARSVAAGAVVFRAGTVETPGFLRDDEDEKDEPAAKPGPKSAKRPKSVKRHLVTPLLTDDEDAFVRGGGRIVIAADDTTGSLTISDIAQSTLAHKVFPLWRGLDTIELPEARAVGGDALRNAHAVYAIENATAVARLPIGTGDAIVFGAPETLDNENLAKNLPLLLALTGGRKTVYFDERVHGITNDLGAVDLMKDWGLGPFLLLLLVIAAVVFWRYGTRIGTPDDEYRDTRSEAIDLVGSLGALYDRTMTRGEMLAAYYRELTRAVASSTGLRGDALHKRVSDLTHGMSMPWKHQNILDDEFDGSLKILNEAFAVSERHRPDGWTGGVPPPPGAETAPIQPARTPALQR